MFTEILDNKSRSKIASFFLSVPTRAYHSEEVRKATGETGSVVVGNLKALVRAGFLRTVERKGEYYYRFNNRYQYYEEMKDLLTSSRIKYKDKVIAALEKLNKVSLLVLTGLFTAQPQIPTDILIVGEPQRAALNRAIEALEKELKTEINYTVFSKDEYEQRVNMFDRFTRDLFDHPHLMITDKINATKTHKKNLKRIPGFITKVQVKGEK